jgi:hypothetical protein
MTFTALGNAADTFIAHTHEPARPISDLSNATAGRLCCCGDMAAGLSKRPRCPHQDTPAGRIHRSDDGFPAVWPMPDVRAGLHSDGQRIGFPRTVALASATGRRRA